MQLLKKNTKNLNKNIIKDSCNKLLKKLVNSKMNFQALNNN